MIKRKNIVLTMAIITTLGLVLSEVFIRSAPLLQETRPIFTARYLIRSIYIMFTSGLWVWSIVMWNPRKTKCILQCPFSLKIQKWILASTLFISMVFLICSQVSPEIFDYLALEDQIIEYSSAFFYFISFGLLVYIYSKIAKVSLNNLRYYKLILSVLALIFLIFGLEEISWFQRVFKIEVPEFFDKNSDGGAINIHNLATNLSENVYYIFGFLFLILVLFVVNNMFHDRLNMITSFFTPSRLIIFVGAISMAYNHDMWNIVFTQICFFMTLFILILSRCKDDPTDYKFLIWTLIGVYMISQGIYLFSSDLYIRIWVVTEYKEFLIPMAFFLYSIELCLKAKKFA